MASICLCCGYKAENTPEMYDHFKRTGCYVGRDVFNEELIS